MKIVMERRFDINPHVIRQLGEELVPDEMTALMELIKNAYDADASYVKIDINTAGVYSGETLTYPSHTGYIVVEDSGIGMDDEAIVKSWLTISYSNKRAGVDGFKKKTKKERTPLGVLFVKVAGVEGRELHLGIFATDIHTYTSHA